jgi:hypothetical protein
MEFVWVMFDDLNQGCAAKFKVRRNKRPERINRPSASTARGDSIFPGPDWSAASKG